MVFDESVGPLLSSPQPDSTSWPDSRAIRDRCGHPRARQLTGISKRWGRYSSKSILSREARERKRQSTSTRSPADGSGSLILTEPLLRLPLFTEAIIGFRQSHSLKSNVVVRDSKWASLLNSPIPGLHTITHGF